MTCTKEGRNSSNLSHVIQGSITFMALIPGCNYFSDAWDEMNIDREGANAVKETFLDNQFWSQVRYVLQFTKTIYNMIKFADSDRPIIGRCMRKWIACWGRLKTLLSLEMSTYIIIFV
jgi:hypothetical protein